LDRFGFTAIDTQRRAHDPSGPRRQQEGHRLGDVLARALSADPTFRGEAIDRGFEREVVGVGVAPWHRSNRSDMETTISAAAEAFRRSGASANGLAPEAAIRFAVASSVSVARATMATFSKSRGSRLVVACPMLRLAPVIIATRGLIARPRAR
jgi:hypothetical protein